MCFTSTVVVAAVFGISNSLQIRKIRFVWNGRWLWPPCFVFWIHGDSDKYVFLKSTVFVASLFSLFFHYKSKKHAFWDRRRLWTLFWVSLIHWESENLCFRWGRPRLWRPFWTFWIHRKFNKSCLFAIDGGCGLRVWFFYFFVNQTSHVFFRSTVVVASVCCLFDSLPIWKIAFL